MDLDKMIARATDARQYDADDINFQEIGTVDSPFRIMFWDYIKGLDLDYAGKSVLDVGCGIGWLLKRLTEAGATRVVGVEPAQANCKKGQELVPSAEIVCTDLMTYDSKEKFDYVFMVLASDYFTDLVEMFNRLKHFVKDGGLLITVDGDYEYHKTPRMNYEIKVNHIHEDEYIASITRPSGTMVGFTRTNKYMLAQAKQAGLAHQKTVEIQPTEGFLEASPGHTDVKHLSLAQINVFKKAD
jgi:SAM-dependent methyltransferase